MLRQNMTEFITTRPSESDPPASAVEALLERFPDLDRSCAAEVVAWCVEDGAFPEGSTLFSSAIEEAYSTFASSGVGSVPVPVRSGVTVSVPSLLSEPPMDVRDSELCELAPTLDAPPSVQMLSSELPMDVRDSELWDLAPRIESTPSRPVLVSELPMDVRDSELYELAASEPSELPIEVTVSEPPAEPDPVIDVTISDAPTMLDGPEASTASDPPASGDGTDDTPWFVSPMSDAPRAGATIPPPSMESMAVAESVSAVSEGSLLAAPPLDDVDRLARVTVSVDSFPSVEGEPGGGMRLALRPARRGRAGVALGVLVVTNSALAAGVLGVRAESHHDRVPVASLSAEVSDLHRESAATRAKLDETRATLDEHAGSIAKTLAVVAATDERQKASDERQKATEREVKEHEAREQREVSALSSRVTRVERRTEAQYSLLEALAIIDEAKKMPSATEVARGPGPMGETAKASLPTSH
jgi:hypothetical protein